MPRKEKRSRRRPKGEPERIAVRQLRALDLRIEGKGFVQIAQELGLSLGQAYADVEASLEKLEDLKKEKAERVLELDLARIDGIIAGHYPRAVDSQDEKSIGSATIVLRALERRAKLLAMDQAEKSDPELDLLKAYLLHRYGFGEAEEPAEPTRH